MGKNRELVGNTPPDLALTIFMESKGPPAPSKKRYRPRKRKLKASPASAAEPEATAVRTIAADRKGIVKQQPNPEPQIFIDRGVPLNDVPGPNPAAKSSNPEQQPPKAPRKRGPRKRNPKGPGPTDLSEPNSSKAVPKVGLNPKSDVYIPREPKPSPILPIPVKKPTKKQIRPTAPHIEGHSTLASELISQINSNKYECMVCYDIVQRQQTIYHCPKCYAMFHIHCIKKWSRQSELNWRCPGCQYTMNSAPEARCFCGKIRDPEFDVYVLPHSCGDPCGRARGYGCPHPCEVRCHPGPCDSCSRPGATYSCFCGKTHYETKCGAKVKQRSCGELCGKSLDCGNHTCDLECHEGPCKPCQRDETQRCYCGKHEEVRRCGTGAIDKSRGDLRHFACPEVCGLALDCGKHMCSQRCHVGLCQPCARNPEVVKTCPCGRTALVEARSSCLDPIKTCSAVCDNPLTCGHQCQAICHDTPCPPCPRVVQLHCRCGEAKTSRPCNQADTEYLCQRKCNRAKSCGRHKCNVKCCPASPQGRDPGDAEGHHLCHQPCDKPLNCGTHRCEQICHKGKCARCLQASFDELSCTCGKTVLMPPISCGTPPPVCPHPCSLERPCGHKEAPNLGHSCHTGGCPPCSMLTQKVCDGGHKTMGAVRCSINSVSCGGLCNKPMPCTLHNCRKSCHSEPCFDPERMKVSPEGLPPSCLQTCEIRRTDCDHVCKAFCHPGTKCPNTPCQERITIHCTCGRLSKVTTCNRHNPDQLVDNPTGFPTVQEIVDCDEQCEIEQRNQKLASAFGITSKSSAKPPDYSDLLIDLARSAPNTVYQIERRFSDLILGINSNITMPPMDNVTRRLVHELARYYMLATTSVDQEPERRIIVSRRRGSRIPSVLLSAYAPQAPRATFEAPQPKPPAILHIYGLDKDVRPTHLASFLQPFAGQYKLQWLDDENCLAIFRDHETYRQAENILSSGIFKVKEYSDNFEPPQRAPTIHSQAKADRMSREPRRIELPPTNAPLPQANSFGILQDEVEDWEKRETEPATEAEAANSQASDI